LSETPFLHREIPNQEYCSCLQMGAQIYLVAECVEFNFRLIWGAQCHPGVHEVLCDVLGLPLSDAELGIVLIFRMATMRGKIELERPFKKALE